MTKKLDRGDIFFIISEKNKNIKLKKDIKKIILDFIALINSELKTRGQFKLFNLGKFQLITKKERTGRNPKTGEKIKIPQKRVLKFIPSKKFKYL